MLANALRERLAAIERDGLRRTLRRLDSAQGALVQCEGRPLVNFSSNDYLGLANHPAVIEALCGAARDYGVGAGAAHLVSGHSRCHQELETELAAFLGRDRALLFSSGYMANVGTIAALAERGGSLFADRLNHASLVDGARLSGAKLRRYPHADVAALTASWPAGDDRGALLVTDGVFSMDGDCAPLTELAALASDRGGWLMVDDAHGIGVIGANGGGLLEALKLGQDQVPILVGTLGKAFGVSGAFVAGCAELIDYLLHRARTYVYSTAVPPAVAAATRAALRIVQTEAWRRDRLRELVARFRVGAAARGLAVLPSATPIQPIVIGANARVVAAGQALFRAGFWVGAIRPPTVPVGTARLRVTLTAAHAEHQVDALLDVLAETCAKA